MPRKSYLQEVREIAVKEGYQSIYKDPDHENIFYLGFIHGIQFLRKQMKKQKH